MSRTLIAGRAPRGTKPDPQTDVVNVIWSCLIELWKIGEPYHVIKPKRDRLHAQLCDPVLQQHAKYLEAVERFRRWDAELAKHDMIADGIERNLARHYSKLSGVNRQAIVSGEGWSRLDDPNEWARAMRQRGLAYGPWPSGESGFENAPLRAWLTERMEQERQSIAAGVAALMADSWSRREAA